MNENKENLNELTQAINDLAYGDDGLLTDYYERFIYKSKD